MTNSQTATPDRTLAIVGQGYVGLPLAMAAVDAGWSVIGVEKSTARVAQLNSGSSPVEDISDERLAKAIAAKKYFASTNPADISAALFVTICVPTPLDSARNPDLELLENATKDIAPFLRDGTLLVNESTSYPGTLRDVIIPIVNSSKPSETKSLYFASAPERVNPGDLVWDQKNTPRLIGGIDEESQKRALAFYNSICDSVVATSTPEIAEAAKILENTFRLVNISLINEFTQLCSAQGINVHEVINAAATKPYGFMPFRPGVGIGGHCIPVDPLYLAWRARVAGVPARFVELAGEINADMPFHVVTALEAALRRGRGKGLAGSRILVLGAAYKPGIEDVRESPALRLMELIERQGGEAPYYDPLVPALPAQAEHPGLAGRCSLPWAEALACDAALIVTDHDGIDYAGLCDAMPLVVDTRDACARRGLRGRNIVKA